VRTDLVRAFGTDPISCSTLQAGLSYVDTSFGFVAYRRVAGFDIALGPPICDRADRLALLEKFVVAVRRPLFVYLLDDDAALACYAGGRGFRRCGMGIDKIVPLHVECSTSPHVRGALKKAARAGLVVAEVFGSDVDAALRERLAAITRSYLARSAVPVEMRFLNRPFDVNDDVGRLFVLRVAGEVLGYAVVDPYKDGGLLNLLRFGETKLWGLYYAVAAILAERLRNEGARELSLGWCPLVDIDLEGALPILARQVRWMQQRFLHVKYLARLQEMKAAFAGHTVQRYLVTSTALGPALGPALVLALVRASGVPLPWMIGPQLFAAFSGPPAPH
jgi:lysylphosphatidylglycerol synthetase-like protein (DUF2156 family)